MPSSACAAGDAVCERVRAMEPSLPIHPTFMADSLNPCVETSSGPRCLPYVHVISGWHMFSEEALGWLKQVKTLEARGGSGCFADWQSDAGGGQWAQSWGKPPIGGGVILAHCNKLLSWYPAFAGRYTSAWGKAYGPCKESEIAAHPNADYYATSMWAKCRPAALQAHDLAIGVGGSGHEATPPYVMRALYGSRVRIISALRNPVDRLETAFWAHRHYPLKYGASANGLHAYIREQTEAFLTCERTHGVRRCAYMYELLDRKYADVFFHADQIIRGMYEPFVRDWHAAFGAEALLVLRVEELLDAPAVTRTRVLNFLKLPSHVAGASDAAAAGAVEAPVALSYRALHAKSLREANAKANLLNSTRALAEAFYRPHNERLGALLGWPQGAAWPISTAVNVVGLR